MPFEDKYGNLSTVQCAIESLLSIAREIKPESLVDNPDHSSQQKYDLIVLRRMIEGLQMIIWANGGTEPHTWLPKLFERRVYKNYGAK